MSHKNPTRPQINLAATLYGLALLAETDDGNSEMGSRVRQRMSARAREALARYNLSPSDVYNEDEALWIAMHLKPENK